MQLILLLAADYANVSREGKLNVMGIFDHLNALKFPIRHPQMHLVVRLRAELGEVSGSRKLVVKLVDEDGNEITNLSRNFTMPKTTGGRRPDMNFIMGLRNLTFPAPGTYEFRVLVDEEFKGSVPIYARQIERRRKA